MLPKFARLFLFATVLASTNAHGAPGAESSRAREPGRCLGGRITNASEAASFAGCRTVTGDLAIEHSDLSDLSALAELRSVSGALVIRDNLRFRDLRGLERLERAGSLTLHANGLYTTRGVESLRQVGMLVVTSNQAFDQLARFPQSGTCRYSSRRQQSAHLRSARTVSGVDPHRAAPRRGLECRALATRRGGPVRADSWGFAVNGEGGENRASREVDCDELRECAVFTLAGAYIFGADTTYLPSSAGGDGQMRQGSRWPFLVTCAVWVAIFVYLALTA